jgi:hypothetical protein
VIDALLHLLFHFRLFFKACMDASRFHFACFYSRFTIYWFLLLGNTAFGNGLDGLTGADYRHALYIILLTRAATAGSSIDRVADMPLKVTGTINEYIIIIIVNPIIIAVIKFCDASLSSELIQRSSRRVTTHDRSLQPPRPSPLPICLTFRNQRAGFSWPPHQTSSFPLRSSEHDETVFRNAPDVRKMIKR